MCQIIIIFAKVIIEVLKSFFTLFILVQEIQSFLLNKLQTLEIGKWDWPTVGSLIERTNARIMQHCCLAASST